MKTINVGLIGLGTIGTGVVDYLLKEGPNRFGIHLKKVAVKDVKKPRHVSVPSLINNPKEIINDKDIHIVVELIGGQHPAGDYIAQAIKSGKSVVTANKAVISRRGKELFKIARNHNVDLGFEASVGGGIPIIEVLKGFTGQKIEKMTAIINGTTNYIFSRMEEGICFDEALLIAQKNGFAESEHKLDTGGADARDKLAILASVIFNTHIKPERIYCEGITDISPTDIDFAAKHEVEEGGLGYVVKLLASAIRHDDALELHVYPALIRKNHPLANVRDEFNAIYVEGELSGPQMYYGRGAGQSATASAVISDIVRIANNIRKGVTDDIPTLNTKWKVTNAKLVARKGYLRINLEHIPGSAGKVLTILGRHEINVVDSDQRKKYGIIGKDGTMFIPDIITTEKVGYGNIAKALKQIEKSDRTLGKPVYLRFEE